MTAKGASAQEELRARVRDAVQRLVAPFAREADASRVFQRTPLEALAKEGLVGAPIPRQHGGQGMTNEESVVIYEEVGRACAATRGFLAVQVGLVALVCFWPTFRLMGRDYDAAVMSSGFCGFMLGTTANAMANMGVLAEKYGPAPRAYLVVPMVGAFFIDFTNALIITAFLNLWR